MPRYVLIDYQHLAHKFRTAEALYATVKIKDEYGVERPERIDTTIPNYTIKNIYSISGKGEHYTGIFFEGGNSKRRAYFAQTQDGFDGLGYKGNRQRQTGPFYKGIDMAIRLMLNAGVSLYRQKGYEADDLIISMVRKIKSVDTVTPIDIITNDSDLLPLVDDQVSVYIRSTRQFSVDGSPTHRLYFQVTPETWDDYLSYASAYRDYIIPYNSMLLFKLIRGDKTDNIVGSCKGYGPKKYSEVMEQMLADEVDFPNIFRYGVDFDEVMRPVLENYFTDEQVDHMKFIYTGVTPEYCNLQVPKQINGAVLQKELSTLHINLNI